MARLCRAPVTSRLAGPRRSKEIGYDKTRMWRVFKTLGLGAPEQIRLAALWARAQYLRDHKFSLKETARITGFTEASISRKLTRFG